MSESTRCWQVRVVVVGAGVIGLPTAVKVIETIPNVDVTLVSDKFSPDVVLFDRLQPRWQPYLVGSTPENLQKYLTSQELYFGIA